MEADLHWLAVAPAGQPDLLAIIALAAASALVRHPLLNGAWSDAGLILRRRVHLELVRASGERAFVRDAQDLNARGIARTLRRSLTVMPGESTFSIAEVGERAVWAMPPIGAGQSAGLGVSAGIPRPVVISEAGIDRVAMRPICQLMLAYDARVLGQGHADAFLREVQGILEAGAFQ
jgi:pyruvate/2-oxoglutarate dehydrogenase complex dihydrolipoamide acyltransferase (E2) component